MSEKIKQYRQQLTCECPGYPNLQGTKDDKRIVCGRKVVIDLALGQSYMQNRRDIQKTLQTHGWHKLKTYGVFQSFCPTCSKWILNKREDNKRVWG